MIVVPDIHTERLELAYQFLDLRLTRIAPHVANVFIRASTEDEEDRPRHSIGDCNFGFVCRAQTELKRVVFGPVKGTPFFRGSIRCMDQDLL